MFTKTEKGYLAITILFLTAGSGLKAYRQSSAELGPFPDPVPTLAIPETTPSDSQSAPSVPDSSMRLAESEPVSKKPHPPSRSKKGKFQGKVNLNQADVAELTQVQGLGPKTAQAIVEHRKSKGLFRDLRDLLQVKGIGEKKLEKLRAYLIL